MHFKKRLFTVFVIFGVIVFILGCINSPMLWVDRTFLDGLAMKADLRELRYLILSSMEADTPESKKIEDKISEVDGSLELILNEARKRHYSKWPTDALAAGIIVVGLIVTLLSSWRADTKTKLISTAPSA